MTMFCPHCGTGEQSADAYCKRCGEWLPSMKGLVRHGFGGTTPEQNLRTLLWLTACSAATALVLAIIFFVTDAGAANQGFLLRLARSFFFVIALWQFSILYIGYNLQQRLKKGRSGGTTPELGEEQKTPALGAADFTQYPQATVTENTTELLDAVPRRAKERGQRDG
jgi:hypothetical protein